MKHINNFFKHFILLFTLAFFNLACIQAAPYKFDYQKTYNTEVIITDTNSKSMSNASAMQIVDDMKFGWNLGNTFDAYTGGTPENGFLNSLIDVGLSSETKWVSYRTTQAMIKGIKAKGFNTIRIPISWHGHFIDKNYTIDPKWMARIKEVVDWAIDEGLYVIINIHHDNVAPKTLTYSKGFSLSDSDRQFSMPFLFNVWNQIATAFNSGYDEHLIFETLNEPRLVGDSHEWSPDDNCSTCKKALNLLNEYNQLCVDVIRSTGKNNATRLIMIPSYAAQFYTAPKSQFKMPKDSATNRLVLSTHMYAPYDFAMKSPGDINFTQQHKNELNWNFSELNKKFVSQGIPVVIGEMGATNKDNLDDRKEWFNYFLTQTKTYKMCAILWDNSRYQITKTTPSRFEELYGYYNRSTQTWYFEGLVEEGINARK